MEEIWKDKKDYEGLYQVSNLGRAKSLDRYIKGKGHSLHLKKGRILKPMKDNNGYLKVRLYNGEKSKTFNLHRLVAEAFIPNPNNLPEVNHKNEIKTDNRVENLEWCDRKYNMTYGNRLNNVKKPVIQYTLDGEFVREWESAKQAEREGGFNQGSICMCCRGNSKYHKGFKWSYKKNGEDYLKPSPIN